LYIGNNIVTIPELHTN